MKIAYFILNSFDIDSRARLEVETLKNAGHDIEIIATVGCDSKSYLGCPIHRIAQWKWPSRKTRFIQFNLLAAKLGQKIKPDIYHAVDLDVLQAAVRAAEKSGGRVIYEARELYTELESLKGRSLVRNFWRELEARLIGRTTGIITINDSIADELARRYGIERPIVIRNTARTPKSIELVDLHSLFNIPHDWKILIYQGVLRKGQGLEYLLDLIARIEKVTLLIMGSGHIENELKEEVRANGLGKRVIFTGHISPDQLQNYTSAGDAGMLLMEDVALNNRLALPQKIFQYLSCGLPQIVSSMPEIAGFVEKETTGLVVPLNERAIAAQMISEFLNDAQRLDIIRQNCRASALRNNWEIESMKLVDLYKGLEQSR